MNIGSFYNRIEKYSADVKANEAQLTSTFINCNIQSSTLLRSIVFTILTVTGNFVNQMNLIINNYYNLK